MPQPPFVTVIMPVYNTERYVAEAVESILGQTYSDFEFLIADGGSTDKSRAIIERYAAKDTRIRLWTRPNTSPQERLNEMLDEARGNLVALMNADDVALPERFERQVAFLQANPDHALVGSQILIIDPEGDPLCIWAKEQTHEEIESRQLYLYSSIIHHPALMYRREAVLAIGKYRTELYFGDDLDLFLRLGERGWRMANLPLVLLKIRMHPQSVCHQEPLAAFEKTQEVLREARQRRGLPEIAIVMPDHLDMKGDPFDERLKWGWWALKAGYVSTARKQARHCFRRAPFSKQVWRLLYCALRGH
jgi:glycosyltransferase involved in cell wall biosynthesis